MNKRLYIGNLSSDVTEQDLTHNFSSVGKVATVAIIKDRFSNQSKGFGFVEMESEEEAQKAIAQFNGGELRGKKITVSEARERKEREGGFGGGRGGAGRSSGSGFSRGSGGGGRRY
jgi:RNA recognition motif-containing protein